MSDDSPKLSLVRPLVDAALIVVVGSLIGLAVNGRLLWEVLERHALSRNDEPVAEELATRLPLPIGLEELRGLLPENALLIDARHRDSYRRGHLPGARNLPWGDAGKLLPALRDEVSPQTTLVVYCSGYGCEDSFLLAERLLRDGYRDVRVFEGGVPAWRAAGLPLEGDRP